MWNDTDPFLVPSLEEDILLEASGSSVSPPSPTYEIDESSYSIFFSTYNPSSPVYAQNSSEFGISVGMLKFCIEGVGITTVAILGVIGNMLSICVLSSSRMKNSVSCFLICLAICDIVALVGATILIGIPSLLIYHPEDDGSLFVFNKNIVKYANIVHSAALFAISVTAISGSIFFTMALTLERYLAVCHPFFARNLCTWTRAKFMSAFIIALSIGYNLPRWWEFMYVEEQTINNLTMFRPLPTSFRMNPTYDTYYVHLSYAVLQFFVPVCFLIIFNILIYKQIKLANTIRKNLSPMQKIENSLTRMLFGVVAVFLLCNLTPALHTLYRYAKGTREFLPAMEFVWCFMIILNSSVNFLIYCATGGKFREVFCDMFCCWRKSARIRQFAASTKTTFRSMSISNTSRSRAYSIYSTCRGYNTSQHLNHTNNNAIFFPDGKFSIPATSSPIPPPLVQPAAPASGVVKHVVCCNQHDIHETISTPTIEEVVDVSFIV